MKQKAAGFASGLIVLFLLLFSSGLLLADSVRYLASVVQKVGLDPVVVFILSWTSLLLLRIKRRNFPRIFFYSYLYILVPVSTLLALAFTYLELSHFYNYVYSNFYIRFENLTLWSFANWLFLAVLIPSSLWKKHWRRIVFIGPVLFLIGMALVWAWPQDVFLKLVREDDLIENAQVLVLLVGAVSSFLLAKSFGTKKVFLAGVFFLVSIGLFFIAGDEISWGQRLLGIATPEQLAQENLQQEVTVHNLNGIHQLVGLGYVLIGLYGAFAWIAADFIFVKKPKALKYFVTPQYLFFFFYLSLVYNAYTLGGPHQFGEWSEVAELMLYSGVSIFLVIHFLLSRLKKF